MNVLKYAKQFQRYHTSDDVHSREDYELSLPKRPKTVGDCKLSAGEIDAILSTEVPDLGNQLHTQQKKYSSYKPCTAGRQIHRSNTPAQTVEDYWHLNLFYPFTDQLTVELQNRLCKPMPRLKAQYLLSSHVSKLNTEFVAGC